MSASPTPGKKVTRADIEAKLREVQTELTAGAENAKSKVLVAGGVLVVVLLLVAFLLGRRAARRSPPSSRSVASEAASPRSASDAMLRATPPRSR